MLEAEESQLAVALGVQLLFGEEAGRVLHRDSALQLEGLLRDRVIQRQLLVLILDLPADAHTAATDKPHLLHYHHQKVAIDALGDP